MSKSDLRVDWATHKASKYACENWHYSGSLPDFKSVKIGVWEREKFIGVVVFGRGTCNHLAHKYGCDNTSACELVRVALNAHIVPVSRIVSVALRFLKKKSPNMLLVVSFASQDEGHYGGIYQAGNWIYSGTTRGKDEFLLKGKRVADRTISQLVQKMRISRVELERIGVIVRLKTMPFS